MTSPARKLQGIADFYGQEVSHTDAAIIPGMALSSKEKQEAFRARNEMLGLTEVRGIYLPKAMHAELKAVAEKMRRRVSAIVPPHSEQDDAK